jgi:uroporphyrinogen decarboxylase
MRNQCFTPKEKILELLQGRESSSSLFLPAIYDFKARLAGIQPHLFGASSEEVVRAMEREIADIGCDVLTSGYDIYNTEAEALGATVIRDERIGMPDISVPIIKTLDELSKLRSLENISGRMNVFVEAAKIAVRRWGSTIPVRGAISGPFSMASKLFPHSDLITECILNPDGVKQLLAMCTQTAIVYASAFLSVGAQVIAFDSFISPPVLSPDLYKELVLPFHKELFNFLIQNAVQWRPLIVGGDTRSLIPYMVESGANQLLIDYVVPPEAAGDIMDSFPDTLFRYNLSPALMLSAFPGFVEKSVSEIASCFRGRRNFILGTAVLPFNTPIDNIRAARIGLNKPR